MTYHSNDYNRETGERERTTYYDFIDLAYTFFEMHTFEEDHEGHIHYKSKLEAMQKAMGVEIVEDAFILNFFLSSAVTTYTNSYDPFGISLEGPGSVESQQFRSRHSHLPKMIELVKTGLVQLLADALADHCGGNKTIEHKELLAAGFDPDKTPLDPYGYI